MTKQAVIAPQQALSLKSSPKHLESMPTLSEEEATKIRIPRHTVRHHPLQKVRAHQDISLHPPTQDHRSVPRHHRAPIPSQGPIVVIPKVPVMEVGILPLPVVHRTWERMVRIIPSLPVQGIHPRANHGARMDVMKRL